MADSFGSSYFWLTQWAIASKRRRLDGKTPFVYPDLECYRKDVVEKAVAPESVNWLTLPEEVYPKYAHLCQKITDGYVRPIFSKGDVDGRCVVFQTNKVDEIDFILSHFPPARNTWGYKYAILEYVIH